VRRLIFLTGSVVFVDTLFFAALTPLLPHYAQTLGLDKSGAGVLAAAYPAGTFVGAIPSGIVAARVGVKPTVLCGLTAVAACIALFATADQAWQLDAARFLQGVAGSFSWTGALAWLVAGTPAAMRGALIGQALAAAILGDLLGPVLGGIASVAGIGLTFGVVAVASLGLAVWALATPAARPDEPQGPAVLIGAVSDPRIRTACWLVLLPALLIGALSVLAPLRLSTLGFGAVGIGAVFLCSAALDGANNLVVGRAADRFGPIWPLLTALGCSALAAAVLPWPAQKFALAAVVIGSGVAFGALFTPGITLLSKLSENRGLDHGYTAALVSLAWAPGQALGAAGGGALAYATTDAVPYLLLSAVCALTLARLWPTRLPGSVPP
jgi:MFS family permease